MHTQDTQIHGLNIRFVQPQSAQEVVDLWPTLCELSEEFSPPLSQAFYDWLCLNPTMLMVVYTEGLATSWVVQDVANSPTLAEIQGCIRPHVEDYVLAHCPGLKARFQNRTQLMRLSREVDFAITINVLDNLFLHHNKHIAYIRCSPKNKYAKGFALTWGFKKVGLSPKDNNLVYQLTREDYPAKKRQMIEQIQKTRLNHPEG